MLHYRPHRTAQSSTPGSRSLASAYTNIRHETGLIGADAHHLIALLLDGLTDNLLQARGAMQRGDVQAKCAALSRAARIVEEGLNAALNRDAGVEIAETLNLLYGYLGVLITKANLRGDASMVDEALSLVSPVRQAWKLIAPAQEAVR